MIIGCKLLKGDNSSLNGRFVYQENGWQSVPGNGSYVAITGSLFTGGMGEKLIYMECDEKSEVKVADKSVGVRCFSRVRLVPSKSKSISPELRGEVACYARELSVDQRFALAIESTPEWRGRVARYADGLSAEQRVALVKESTPEWRGWVACYAPGLSAKQRMELKF